MLYSLVRDEVTAGLALLSDEEVEATAAHAWGDLEDPTPEDLARRRGVTVVPARDLPVPFDGLVVDDVLFVRPSRTRGVWFLRLLHELAHHYLGAARAHTHADVWRLSLALAWPVPRVRAGLPAVEIPGWALTIRAGVLAETRVITAA